MVIENARIRIRAWMEEHVAHIVYIGCEQVSYSYIETVGASVTGGYLGPWLLPACSLITASWACYAEAQIHNSALLPALANPEGAPVASGGAKGLRCHCSYPQGKLRSVPKAVGAGSCEPAPY